MGPAQESGSPLLFREEQPWRGAWAGPLLFAGGLAIVGAFSWMLVEQLLLGRPVGGRPAPDAVLAFFGALMILVGLGMLLLALGGRLVTEVRADALYVQHYPLTRRHRFCYDRIASCEARRYRPIAEYGGWGVRGAWLGKGRAYNVSGNEGVQLVFGDGKRLLVGSRRASELAQAIGRAKQAAGKQQEVPS